MPRDLETNEGGGQMEMRRRPSDLDGALDRLKALADEDLPTAWQDRFGAAPPSVLPSRLLRLAIAYDLHAAALGSLGRTAENRLMHIATGELPARPTRPTSLVQLKPGVTLLRDWGGRSYRVEVQADGSFNFQGQTWRSLSAIAREITGTSRNGPAFFGLRGGAGHGAA